LMIREALSADIPLIVGSCGGSGAKPHLEWTRDIVDEIIAEIRAKVKIGLIYADIEKSVVIKALEEGRVQPLPGLPELTVETVKQSTNIVAQMGVEPIIKALEQGCRIILAGRAYDPAVFSAMPIKLGFDAGLATHMGKILECAAIAADPGSGSDCVMGVLEKDSFTLVPLSNERRFTPESVAAHTLYEKSDPCNLPGPDGVLNLEQTTFAEEEGGRARVAGSRFVKSGKSCIKLEAARLAGYRTISVAGVRDPVMIGQIDDIVETVVARAKPFLKSQGGRTGRLFYHIYGKNAVMGGREPVKDSTPHELGIVMEAVAPTQEQANSICSFARSTMLHYGYPGRISTAGNLAFPFSPSDVKAGPVYEFSIYHLMETTGLDLFRLEVIEV